MDMGPSTLPCICYLVSLNIFNYTMLELLIIVLILLPTKVKFDCSDVKAHFYNLVKIYIKSKKL